MMSFLYLQEKKQNRKQQPNDSVISLHYNTVISVSLVFQCICKVPSVIHRNKQSSIAEPSLRNVTFYPECFLNLFRFWDRGANQWSPLVKQQRDSIHNEKKKSEPKNNKVKRRESMDILTFQRCDSTLWYNNLKCYRYSICTVFMAVHMQ